MRPTPGQRVLSSSLGYELLAATRISATPPADVQENTMNDLPKDQTLGRLPDASQEAG